MTSIRTLSLTAALALVGIVAVACGDDVVYVTAPDGTSSSSSSGAASSSSGGSSSSGDDDGITPADVQAYAEASCNWYDRCSTPFIQQRFGDLDACVTKQVEVANETFSRSGFATTPDQLRACTAKIEGIDCNDSTQTEECTFKGTLADGAACVGDSQCEGGACVIKAEDTCGECATLGAKGDACGAEKPLCGPGLRCNGTKCVERVGKGAACQSYYDCADGLVCSAKKCQTPLAAGASCAEELDRCSRELRCIDGECAKLSKKTVKTGATCPEGTDAWCGNGLCDTETNECVAWPDEGEACTGGCKLGLSCRKGKCVKVSCE